MYHLGSVHDDASRLADEWMVRGTLGAFYLDAMCTFIVQGTDNTRETMQGAEDGICGTPRSSMDTFGYQARGRGVLVQEGAGEDQLTHQRFCFCMQAGDVHQIVGNHSQNGSDYITPVGPVMRFPQCGGDHGARQVVLGHIVVVDISDQHIEGIRLTIVSPSSQAPKVRSVDIDAQ